MIKCIFVFITLFGFGLYTGSVIGFREGHRMGENAVARTSMMNFVQLLAVLEDQELIKNDNQREFLLLKYEIEKAADLPNDLMQVAELANGLADIDFK